MTPDYEYNDKCHIRFFNCDNMDFMKEIPDNYFELCICDIPYGLGEKLTQGGTWAAKYKKSDSDWDVLPSEQYFNELFRISQNQIIWGGNYANLPPTRCFLIWDKVALMDTMADCEFAWTSFDKNAKIYRHPRNTTEKRIHITQKPIALYRWLLQNYAKKGDKILDTHGGSFTHARACYEEEFDLDIMELDKEYFDKGVQKFKEHVSQYSLF